MPTKVKLSETGKKYEELMKRLIKIGSDSELKVIADLEEQMEVLSSSLSEEELQYLGKLREELDPREQKI